MRRTILVVIALVVFTALAMSQNKAAKTLDIYVVDVEGGNAVLFVTPAGESVLIDTGNTGAGAARDAGRIADASWVEPRTSAYNIATSISATPRCWASTDSHFSQK